MAMSTMNGGIRKMLISFLNAHLPNRTKRLVFLASLTARLKGSSTFDNETLQKLNKVMELGRTDSALKLPYELSRAIWHGQTSYQILNADVSSATVDVRKKEMAANVINTMPVWLRYGDDLEIEKDVERLLDNKSILLGA